MRILLLFTAVLASIANTGPAPASTSLRGTTRPGDRSEPYAVVWLDAPAGPAPASKVVLDQRNLDFWPHVLAVRVGTIVEFPNNDRVFHNVFSFRDGKKFDLGMYPVGTIRRVTFDHPGLSRIFCNIHPNMGAHVMVVETPYFTVSGADGRFTIAAVPPGTYTYHAWRPGRPELSGSAVIGPATVLELHWQ
jgi:plastocyanin